MKIQIREIIIASTVLMLSTALPSYADSVISDSPDRSAIWAADFIEQHPLNANQACTSSILGSVVLNSGSAAISPSALLEVVSLRNQEGQFTRPTVLVRVNSLNPNSQVEFDSADLVVELSGQTKSFSLMSAGSTPSASGNQTLLIIDADSRLELIEAIKAGSRANLDLKKNREVKAKAALSLRGSSRATSAMLSSCSVDFR